MSYIKKRGEQAAQSALEEKKDFSKSLVKFKSGTTYTVRFASEHDFVSYDAVSIFGKINTTPVLEGNLYEKAVKHLYDDADKTGSEDIRTLASQLRPRERYLLAFFDLETGQPSVVDLSKKQAKTVIAGIQKYAKKLSTLAFELTKSGSGQDTTVTISPVIDEDDLTKDQKKHFEATKGKAIEDEIFDVLYMRNADEQAEDLQKIGFDVSRLGLTVETKSDDGEYDF